jgi:hypothetical protein
MSVKPTDIVAWALALTYETRLGNANKLEPTPELQNNGTLDGSISLQNINFIFNVLGLWSSFLNDMVVTTNGAGTGLTKDDHYSFIVAFDKTDLSKYVTGIAFKNGVVAASVQTLQSATLALGTPEADGDLPITGATSSNIVAFSLNFKLS